MKDLCLAEVSSLDGKRIMVEYDGSGMNKNIYVDLHSYGFINDIAGE
jgi:TRAP-type uncharacterized transport system substrate-binding protein